MVSHGQVSLGKFTFGLCDMDRPLDQRKARGRMLKYGNRRTRLLGSAPAPDEAVEVTNQLELVG